MKEGNFLLYRFRSFNRCLAALLVFTFTLTNTVLAAPSAGSVSGIAESRAQSAEREKNNSLPLFKSEFGTVEESYQGKSDKTVIYIQDAHESLEAQENIAKLITALVAQEGIKTVFEEGYEGPVPTDAFFGNIPEKDVKEKVSYFLLDKLRLGGAESRQNDDQRDDGLL